MGQRHVCTLRHAQRAAYRTAILAAQVLVCLSKINDDDDDDDDIHTVEICQTRKLVPLYQ